MQSPEGRFPKAARLLRAAEFRYVFQQAETSRDAYFTVLARKRHTLSGPGRLGMAIARKHAPRAVDRNRLKRLIRESFRRNREHLLGLDCIVLCRHGTVNCTNEDLSNSLDAHWSRLRRRLCEDS